jgi:glycosyltransferase involved in cell wall biosynthesis
MEDVDIIHAHDLYSLLVISEIKKILLKQNSKKYPKFVFTVRDYLVLCALGALLTKDCNEVCKKCSFSNLMNCLSLKKKGAIIKCGVLIFPSLVRKRKESFSLMDGVIYISQHIRNVFESRIKYNGSTAVIYNPFPPEWFFGRQLEKEKRSIIYVGRMEEHKGVLLLLRALGYLLKKYPDLHIYFIGEGREKARYMKLAKEYGIEKQVDFTGWLSLQIVMSMYRKASIAVIPSLWNEPFGRVAIEAMASRCIVIVPNSGSFTELIKEGENGYLFVHGDEKSLLNKLERIIENEENLGIIRENAFTYSKGFSIEKSAKEHINFYSGLII